MTIVSQLKPSAMAERDQERDWIRRSQAGDAGAFEELIRRHQKMIHALTYRMTGSPADAEDLAQEIFLQAHRQLGSFRAESKFSTWLYRIGVNASLNWNKRSARREQAHREWAEQADPPAVDSDLTALVQESLMKLDAKQRAAVILTAYDGLNHAEAARALGCSETTVSWRVHVARRKLKRFLERSGPAGADAKLTPGKNEAKR